jgi:hypothetical protein
MQCKESFSPDDIFEFLYGCSPSRAITSYQSRGSNDQGRALQAGVSERAKVEAEGEGKSPSQLC